MLLSKVIFNWNPLKISVSTTGFLKKKYLRPDWWKVHSVRQLHQTEIAYYAGVEENSSDYAKNSIILESLYGPVEIPQLNLPQFIWRNVDKWADKPMATCAITGRTYNYSFGRNASKLFASALISQCGLKKGDVIGFLLPNLPEFVVAINGALEAGIIVTFVNPLYTAEEVKRQFENADVVCCLTIPNFSHIVNAIMPQLPNMKSIIMLNPPNATNKTTDIKGKVFDFTDMIKSQKSPIQLPVVLPEDIAVLPYSSGTTGLPKGVILTHLNCTINMMQLNHPALLEEPDPNNLPTGLCVLPFFHIFGYNGILNVLLAKGAHVVTLPKFTPQDYIAALIKYKPERLYLVPSLLAFLVSQDAVKPEYLESVQDIVVGAAPCTNSLLEKFREKFSYPDLLVRQGYGMTELSPSALFAPLSTSMQKVSAAGQLVKGTQARVVSLVNGNDQPAMQPGELWIKGPQIMKGYWKNEKATKETIDADGWLHTGDVVYYDEDGFFYVIDRTKELMKVKGNQVSPTELENIVIQIPGVADVAVVGIPDEVNGENPKAFVVKRKGFDISEEEIIKYVEPKVVAYKRLVGGVKFLDAIPRNMAGKILRNDLKKLN